MASEITDKEIEALAKGIGINTNLDKLGLNLGYGYEEMAIYHASNHPGASVTLQGTKQMLKDWREKTSQKRQRPVLKKALKDAGLVRLAEKHLGGSLKRRINTNPGPAQKRLKVTESRPNSKAKSPGKLPIVTKKKATIKKATTKKATTKKATMTKATTKKATSKKATTKKATTEKATTEKATTKKGTTEKATTKKATQKKATTEKATTKKATTEKGTTKKATQKKASTKKATRNEATTKKATREKSTTKKATEMKTGFLKLMLIEKFEERKKRDDPFLRGCVYEPQSRGCLEMFCSMSFDKEAEILKKLTANSFFMVQDVADTRNTERQLRITEKSKIFERGASFEVVEEVVQAYVTPDVIKIAEAKKSLNKRRVSISGVVTWASECRGKKIKVRELRMVEDGEEVKVLLWGDTANKIRRKDEVLKLVGMEVLNDGKSEVTLNSSPSTKIEGAERITEDMIIACTGDRFPLEIVLESGETAEIHDDFGISLQDLPVKVKIERDENYEIVNIQK